MAEKHLSTSKTGSTQETIKQKGSFFAQNDFFRLLSVQELDELERTVTRLSCPPGRILYRPGEAGSALFFVHTGCVQLYHLSTDGRKLITATLTAGACFGELPLLCQGPHHSFAEAVAESELYVILKNELEHLLQQHALLTLALLRLIGQRFLQLETQLVDTAFKSTGARLAALLLELAQPGEDVASPLEVAGLSHEELAERLGVYRETVSAALRDLKGAGAIALGRKKITLTKPERLAEIATVGNKGNRIS
ncbi:MAG TPA: Crp/Fnr family transcriptional regulator [Ktedonobacteraceae bacterium]|nr:Crp/Fnr family transcriptional regulator [Ktedonobacteraceae bacterium]